MKASPNLSGAPTRPESHRATPARITGIYLVSCLTWIWLSDFVMHMSGIDEGASFWIGAVKGSAFVVASAGLVYWSVRREVRALARAFDLLRAVADGMTEGVFVKDREGRYLLVNEAAARFVGKPVAEVLGKDDTELFDPPSAALVMASDRHVMDSGRAETSEKDLVAAGVSRTYIASRAPYRDAGGAVIGVIGTARDITDRKRAESELLTHLRFFESMDRVNRALHGPNDLERTLSAVLDAVLAEFECDRAWLVYPCDPEAPMWTVPMERTRPEYPGAGAGALELPVTPEVERAFRTARDAGGPVRFGPGSEAPLPAEAAARFSVRSQLAMAIYPMTGQPWLFGLHQCSHARVWQPRDERLFQAIGRRLTDALTVMLAHRELRTSEERYRALVEMTPEAIVQVRDGRVVFANGAAARMVGAAEPAAVVGRLVNDHVHPDDLPAGLLCQTALLRDRRAVLRHEIRLRRLDGVYIDVETCAGLCVVHGTTGIQLVARDVTERKRSAALLHHQNRVLERIATGAPLADALEVIVRIVEAEIPGTVCSILLLDRDSLRLRIGSAPNLPAEYNAAVDGVVIGPRVGSCGTAAYTREPVMVADIATNPLWADYKDFALVHGLRACWSTPILGTPRGAAPRTVLGTFAVYARQPGAPDPRFAELISRAEHLACVAIESARATAGLRESEERFRAAMVGSLDAVYFLTAVRAPDGRITDFTFTDVNPKGEALVALPRAAIIGQRLCELLPINRTGGFFEKYVRVLETRTPLEEEFAISALTRDISWLHHQIVPLGDGVVITSRDISERKRTEQALRESEERYRTYVDHAADALFLHAYDGTVLDVNRQACTSLGRTREELIGQTPADFDADVNAAGREQILARLEVGEMVAFDSRHRRKDDSLFPVEVRIRPFSMGSELYGLALVRDITERKRAEAGLRESEERLRLFVEHVAAAIAMFDRDMQYVHVSRRWLTDYGLGNQDLTGRSHYDVFPDLPERWKEVHRRCLGGAVERCEEDRFERADGSVSWRCWEVRPWLRADGTVGGIVIFTEDITARKRMEAQLHQSQKMEAVGRLAGGIAHDFNNLLTVINGFSDLLFRGLAPGDPNRGAIAEIRGAGERAARLTQQLLTYSRKAMIEPKVLDLNELVIESVQLLRRIIGEDIVVATALQPNPARIRADRGQIEQVLMNLAVNARDAMPTGGRITIGTQTVTLGPDELPDDPDLKPGPFVRLTVADTGTGMTGAVLANIFEPFFTTKGVGKGTGLGLAVVHGVVKQSGGHIGVASTVGVGTAFTLLFPAAPARADAARSAPDYSARGPETILLVEDEDAVRTITRFALENYGYTVLAVDGGSAALDTAAAHPGGIDLLLTDVVMPEMGGRQLAEELRRREPGLRVLFMSGYTDDVVLRHGLARAADAFIQKPFTPGGPGPEGARDDRPEDLKTTPSPSMRSLGGEPGPQGLWVTG